MFFISKIKKKIKGKRNRVIFSSGTCGGKIKIKGDDNVIEAAAGVSLDRFNFVVYGNGNRIVIGRNCFFNKLEVSVGIVDAPADGVSIVIGDGVTGGGRVHLFAAEDNSEIIIGDDCMFSSGIDVWCTDSHAICNEDGEVLNQGRSVVVGRHVWVGKDVKIGKNAQIADDSIVGWGSVVTSVFRQPRSVIAGNPARIVKENVLWKRERPNKNRFPV